VGQGAPPPPSGADRPAHPLSTPEARTLRERIRNFCIIAHIDHGKSTLADRLLELTGTLSVEEAHGQVLDSMDLEQERGITIKAHAVRMEWRGADGVPYILNLIDTPGHVDFSYEVSRSLAACEGAILVVDASQGVEAQTLSNFYLALEHDLTILPVVNKIDLPSARVPEVRHEAAHLTGCEEEEVPLVSAKTGQGVRELIEAMVARIPPPVGDFEAPLRALIFDSMFDQFRGVMTYVRVKEGSVRAGDRIMPFATRKVYEVTEVGIFRLKPIPRDRLVAGEVGYILAGMREVQDAKVGDTLTSAERPCEAALPGYRDAKPMVFSGLYPADTADYDLLRDALGKLRLNDAALAYEPETSSALGFGFRCGFLGLLHMEIVQERLEREYGLSLIMTVPSVVYRVTRTNGEMEEISNPTKFPPAGDIETIEEPYVKAQLILPAEFIGNVMKLCQDRRGIHVGMHYIDPTRVNIVYSLPLGEIVLDFYDRLKSVSKGYASFDYELSDYRASDLVRLDLLLNGDRVDPLSVIVHQDKAYEWGRELAKKLKTLIPKQMYAVAIQSAIGSKVIARETISAMRKDVTAKCYGGDITRKRKLLEKQKEGKRRMKQVGTVEIPQEAFLAVLRIDSGSS
jgi:GTP-binding protein LepA